MTRSPLNLKQTLRPAVGIARRGFVVDETFRGQTLDNKERFAAIGTTADLFLPVGFMEKSDLSAFRVIERKPTKVGYRGLEVYGMAPSSSGGTTVGEALNILGTEKLSRMSDERALHYDLDASALAFADCNANVGDPAYVDVPTRTLLSKRFARSRACLLQANTALPTPTAGAMSCPTP